MEPSNRTVAVLLLLMSINWIEEASIKVRKVVPVAPTCSEAATVALPVDVKVIFPLLPIIAAEVSKTSLFLEPSNHMVADLLLVTSLNWIESPTFTSAPSPTGPTDPVFVL